jgi:Lrp/AsnC family transcriptional regulator for asnA, asnC and gidA
VQVDVEHVRAIAEKIAELQSVSGVMIVMGQFNILAICLFDELEHLVGIASDNILAIPGVHHVETSIAVRTIKYNTRVVRITEQTKSRHDSGSDA